ncbi:MAG: GNAT family N-acetyltransferase [Chitinophagaceae bacterium]|nr:GNAT family N-acetyltransferase [Chitinophagaceae bacterium]
MNQHPVLAFNGYSLYALQPEHIEAFHHLVTKNRDRLASFFAGIVKQTGSKEATMEFLQGVKQKQAEKLYLPFILCEDKQEEILCFLDIKNIDWNIPKAELGCFTDVDSAGKKLTQQALQQFVTYCFQELGFLKLFLRTHEQNAAARSIAEKCGFEQEGKIRKDYKSTSGEVIDLLYYGQVNPNVS